ncbi:polysaccharide biosynthesis C-terminal domain-containing protein [Novosphingobium sp. RD2P27]|uniref:Polysaccharide biosynthesis C-terminal domain-containing protein n=1 Tax=Novosphingobium kalidii TaxID=3230299 RepID=A0ABV2CWN9_9SPHN
MTRLASKTMVVIGSRLLTRALQLVFFVILARELSPEGFGTYGVLTSAIFLTGVIGHVGLRQASAQMVGRNQIEYGEAASTVLVAWPFLAVACCLILLNANAEQFLSLDPVSTAACWLAVAAILLISLWQGVLLGRGLTGEFALADTGPRLLQAALVIALLLTGSLDLKSALVSFAAGVLIFLPWLAWRVYRGSTSNRIRLSVTWPMMRMGFIYAISLFLISIQGRIGLFFLNGIDAAHQTGQFFAAQRASEIFLDVASAAAVVLFSETARAEDQRSAFGSAARTACGLFIMFLVLGVSLAIAAPFVVTLVLGPLYAEAESALVVLSLGLAPVAAARVMNSVVSGMGKPWISASVAVVGSCVNLFACSLLAPRFGAVGAAMALVAGQTTTLLGYIVVSRAYFGLRWRDVMPRVKLNTVVTRLRRQRVRKSEPAS